MHPFLARCAQHSSRVVALARGRTLTAGELAARRVAALCLPEGAVVGLSAPPGPVFLAAYLMRTADPGRAAPIAAMGIAALLLGFGTWGAVRAGYTYDDSNVEMLVYAQGGADLGATAEILDRSIFPAEIPDFGRKSMIFRGTAVRVPISCHSERNQYACEGHLTSIMTDT